MGRGSGTVGRPALIALLGVYTIPETACTLPGSGQAELLERAQSRTHGGDLPEGGAERVGRPTDAVAVPVEGLGVDHRGADAPMVQGLLNGADVVSRDENVGCKGLAQDVAAVRGLMKEWGGDGQG